MWGTVSGLLHHPTTLCYGEGQQHQQRQEQQENPISLHRFELVNSWYTNFREQL